MQPHETAEGQDSHSPRKLTAGSSARLGLLRSAAAAPSPHGGGLPHPHVLPQCLVQCWPVYLEPFELTFHIYVQGGEHGLVLAGQVLESVQATLTVTLRGPTLDPGGSVSHHAPHHLSVSSPWAMRRWADLPAGKLIKIRQEVTDAEACPGGFGRVSWSNSLLGGANAERRGVGAAEEVC